MTKRFRKHIKTMGGWLLLYLVILAPYIYLHIGWGDSYIGRSGPDMPWGHPLHYPYGYYLFGGIIGICGGVMMRRHNIFSSIIPAILAFCEGEYVYTYAHDREWNRVELFLENNPRAYWEPNFMPKDETVVIASLIALLLSLAIMIPARIIARHAGRKKSAEEPEQVKKSAG